MTALNPAQKVPQQNKEQPKPWDQPQKAPQDQKTERAGHRGKQAKTSRRCILGR